MLKNRSKANVILIAGLVGIIGAFLTYMSDMLLLGRPVSSLSFLKLGTESMADLSNWRITLGSIIGIIFLPFQITGLLTVHQGLKPASRFLRYLVLSLSAHALIMGVAFHSSYAYIGSGWKLYYNIGSDNIYAIDIVKKFNYYWTVIVTIILVEVILSSILYTFIIITKKTIYPKWMSLLSPIFILIFITPIILIIPAPIGGYIAPGFFNLGTMLFLILSTVTVLKRLKQKT